MSRYATRVVSSHSGPVASNELVRSKSLYIQRKPLQPPFDRLLSSIVGKDSGNDTLGTEQVDRLEAEEKCRLGVEKVL
jgi:hypothetical protein